MPLADRLRDEFHRLAERSGWRQCPLCGSRVDGASAPAAPAPVELPHDDCAHCGRDVPIGAGFCPWCGAAQTIEPEVEPEPEPPPQVWETAEIQLWRGYVKSHFYAVARNGDDERKVLAASGDFRLRGPDVGSDADAVRDAHAGLVDTLLAAGWEEVEAGGAWYERRFRRLDESAPA